MKRAAVCVLVSLFALSAFADDAKELNAPENPKFQLIQPREGAGDFLEITTLRHADGKGYAWSLGVLAEDLYGIRAVWNYWMVDCQKKEIYMVYARNLGPDLKDLGGKTESEHWPAESRFDKFLGRAACTGEAMPGLATKDGVAEAVAFIRK